MGDVEGLFSMEFRKYVQEHNLLCRNLTDRFTHNNWFFQNKNQTYADGFTSAVRHIKMMTGFLGFVFPRKCLVQFWRAEQVANSANDFQLTTRNQTFLLCGPQPFSEGICSYRMKTRDVIITGDGRGGGPISRVFMNNRMEFTPDVAYYSYEEYPQRDTALACLIKCSLIVPLSDSDGRTVGVMEFVSQLGAFLSTLLKRDLMYLNPCKRLRGQYDLDKDSLDIAVSEIKEVIGVLCRSFDIVTAQTWMLCKHCNSLSTSEGCTNELSASYQRFIKSTYVKFGSYCILREGEGVVGKAAVAPASYHNIVYCENVAKFSIIEYPFAHLVKKEDLSASFAICLQSNRSGDQVYVLELFLGPSYVSWGLRKKLVPILDKMRHWFQTFKVAYGGEEIGDNLSVLVVDASSPDKDETLKNESIAPVASASTVQSDLNVTIEANYRGDSVRFQLSASSGIHDLYRQISRKLELVESSYDLSYQDEDNDPILLKCDEDLQLYISSSTKQGNYILLVSIEPKCASPM